MPKTTTNRQEAVRRLADEQLRTLLRTHADHMVDAAPSERLACEEGDCRVCDAYNEGIHALRRVVEALYEC